MKKTSSQELSAFLFLNGCYFKDDRQLVRQRLKIKKPSPLIIAVDGGLKFLQQINLKPDHWLSDLDSAPKIKRGFISETEIQIYSSDKDKTDSELALEFCISRKIKDLTIFGWYDGIGETDHMLGNLMLCRHPAVQRSGAFLHFLDSHQEAVLLRDDSMILRDYSDRRVSVVPLDRKIILNETGMRFRAKALEIQAGQTVGLRNMVTAKRATIAVSGRALVVIGPKKGTA